MKNKGGLKLHELKWNVVDAMENQHRAKTYTGTATRLFNGNPKPRLWVVTLNVQHKVGDDTLNESYNFRPSDKMLLAQLTKFVGDCVDKTIYDEISVLNVVDITCVARCWV